MDTCGKSEVNRTLFCFLEIGIVDALRILNNATNFVFYFSDIEKSIISSVFAGVQSIEKRK